MPSHLNILYAISFQHTLSQALMRRGSSLLLNREYYVMKCINPAIGTYCMYGQHGPWAKFVTSIYSNRGVGWEIINPISPTHSISPHCLSSYSISLYPPFHLCRPSVVSLRSVSVRMAPSHEKTERSHPALELRDICVYEQCLQCRWVSEWVIEWVSEGGKEGGGVRVYVCVCLSEGGRESM